MCKHHNNGNTMITVVDNSSTSTTVENHTTSPTPCPVNNLQLGPKVKDTISKLIMLLL